MPGCAGIGGSVEIDGLLGRDRGEESLGIAGGDADVGFHDSVGQAAGELLPGAAAIGRFEDAAVRAVPSGVLPRAFAGLPQCGIDDIGVGRVDHDAGGADVLILVEDLLEGLAAIGRAVDAALGVRAVGVPGNRDEEPVGIAGIDGHLGNLLAVAQAEVRPGLAGVGGLVDAVADGEVWPMQSFAAADVNDVADRMARRRSRRSIRWAGRRRWAARCGRSRWSSRRRR